MSVTVEGAGIPLSVDVRGDGPPVLVVHDIGRRPPPLTAAARLIAYDRRGYGASGAPEPYEATTVNEQAEDAAAVLRAISGGPAIVAGDGFGALIALDLAGRHAPLVSALALADPPLFAFVPAATEALAAERQRLEEGLREGGPELAVERAGGDPAHARAYFADLAGLASWPVTRAALRRIAQPAAIVITPGARPHVAAAAVALAGLLPAARPAADLDGALAELLAP